MSDELKDEVMSEARRIGEAATEVLANYDPMEPDALAETLVEETDRLSDAPWFLDPVEWEAADVDRVRKLARSVASLAVQLLVMLPGDGQDGQDGRDGQEGGAR